VAIPQPNPLRDRIVSISSVRCKPLTCDVDCLDRHLILPLDLSAHPPLPALLRARTATSSGIFTKSPLLHKTVLNTLCARNHLLRRYAESAIGAVSLPEPYIPQYLFAERSKSAQAVTPGGRSESLAGLFAIQRRALLIDRSGTGNACCCAIWRETGTP
jgi:hypothetical protein